jgi:hypothetical protein
MNRHHVGVLCVLLLLSAGAVWAPGCSSTTIIYNNAPVDSGAKSFEGGGISLPADDAAAFDATIAAAESGATDMGVTDTGATDTGVTDTGVTDMGVTDTVVTDTGMPDSGFTIVPNDAGNCPDADLRCHVDTCSGAGTSISGTVYDPAGKNPLPHVFVFVPTAATGKTPVIQPGATTCDTCSVPIGSYVTATMTDATGSFTLTGVPTSAAVPVVVQLGKWRRQITVATTSCQNTSIPAGQAHLPRNRTEGDMPEIALLTGGLDDIGCFLTRMGIDAGEYGSPHSGGRVDVYQGLGVAGNGPGLSTGTAGNCTNTSCPLWASKASLEAYDIVVLGCEGDLFDATVDAGGLGGLLGGGASNVTAASKQAMHDWLAEGGKVFATHFHYTWFMNGPSDFQGVASWKGYSLGTGSGPAVIQTSFPKGQDFENALLDAGALSNGNLNLSGRSDSVQSVNAPTLAWLKDPNTFDPKYLTFTTPVGSACGKVGFSDLHAGGAPSGDVPGSCKVQSLSAQEKAMELLFFDLSACVSDDSMAPPGPPPSE